MSKTDYLQTIDRQLKEYFLAHRNHKDPLQAYLNRRKQNKRKIIIPIDDRDFDAKILKSIAVQINQKNT